MELNQRPELRQRITLSPQVYQGLNMLAMPIVDLRDMVEAEMLENPVLEFEEFEDETGETAEDRADEAEDERAWEDWLDQYEELDRIETGAPRDPNAEDVNPEEFVGGIQTFDEYLLQQLGMIDLRDDVMRAARAIIGTLDDDGFFVGDCGEIAKVAGVSKDAGEQALLVVQQLDPPGVGARNLKEALRIQAEYLGIDTPLLLALIERHLDDVASNHFRKIVREEKADDETVREAVALLRGLNPRPAGAFSPGSTPAYIVPDVTFRRFGEEWLVLSNNEVLPVLRVSPRYRQLLRADSRADDETRRYVKDKIRAAEAFIRNVDRRKDTVTRIAEVILDVQREFFDDGKGSLRPLRLEDVAVELGVHLSTVSRGVTGKYMATPYGMFELKHFFSGGYRTSTGMDVAATSVKDRIRELLREEDPVHPLSDQRVAEALKEDGIDVARRTVAKYREEMGIEPSWARKRR